MRLHAPVQESTRLRPAVQHALLLQLAAGTLDHRDLKERAGDCRVLRVRDETDATCILKLWNRPGLAGALRRLTRTTPFQRELAALECLAAAGVRVPGVLGAGRIRVPGLAFTQALFLEDLGECRMALDHVKDLLRAERVDAAWKFLEDVVVMTERLLASGIVDLDHSFFNVVATPAGEAVRLDLELAARRRPGSLSDQVVGEMLGRLIGTLGYAAGGHSELVERFAHLLAERTTPGPRALARAQRQVDAMLHKERRFRGLDVDIDLGWL